ncbi:MAG: hypothetical protein QXP35_00680 [Candidatus Micrarchaeaceae archaeon]
MHNRSFIAPIKLQVFPHALPKIPDIKPKSFSILSIKIILSKRSIVFIINEEYTTLP